MRLKDHVARVLALREAENRVSPRAGYVVFSGPYRSNSAGIYCLHKLCDELNRLGFPSFTTGGDIAAPNMDAPMIDVDAAAALCSRGFIAVYGETVSGNPLGAAVVVRWVLNRPGLLGGDDEYDRSELVFSYSNAYTPYIKNRVAGKLHMPTIDQDLFYCSDSDPFKRNLSCYYVGKSNWKDGICDPTRTFEITRLAPQKPELGKIFRASKVLYCFDNSTILIYEALLCGCPVVVIPDGTQTKADYAQLELGSEGIAWGLPELSKSPVDVAGLEARVRKVREQFVAHLEHMIEISQCRVDRAIDWKEQSFKTLDWRSQPGKSLAISGRRLARLGRRLERGLRLWRKRQVRHARTWISEQLPSHPEASHFYCNDWQLSNRKLECYWSSSACAKTDGFDQNETIRITRSLSASQLGTLFRASRRFYSFDPKSRLVVHALACGCPVTIIGDSDASYHILPQGRGSSVGTRAASESNRIAS
jgi:hypothetical protein